MSAVTTMIRQDRPVFGAAMIVIAVFLMSLQDAIIKFSSTELTLWQVFVLRSALAIPVLAALSMSSGRVGRLIPIHPGWAALRSVALVLMYVSIYAAVPVLSLAVVAAAFYTGPLFITLLSVLIGGESVGPRRWFAVSLGFLGVLVILQPGTDSFTALALLPVLSGFFYAVAAILTRTRCAQESPMSLALMLNVALLLAGLFATGAIGLYGPVAEKAAAYPFLLGPWTDLDASGLLLIGVLTLLIVAIGVTLAQAYQAASPVVVATFDYSYLVFAALWSLIIFAEPPTGTTLAGMAMIAGAGMIALKP